MCVLVFRVKGIRVQGFRSLGFRGEDVRDGVHVRVPCLCARQLAARP